MFALQKKKTRFSYLTLYSICCDDHIMRPLENFTVHLEENESQRENNYSHDKL